MPSKSQAQHDLMAKVCQNKAFAITRGIPQEVACEFVKADQEAGLWQDDDYAAISAFVDTLHDKVKKNLTIVKASEANLPYFLHVTPEKAPKYIPRIGTRQHVSEDRTTPRITVADTVLGCLVGYASLVSQFFANRAGVNGKEMPFHNGLYIRKLPYVVALKPNSRLVYDQAVSNEQWLVSYSSETTEYASSLIGKVFIDSVTAVAQESKHPAILLSLYLSCTETVYLTEELRFEPGYYFIQIRDWDSASYTSKRTVSYAEITKETFTERKRTVASKLSAQSTHELQLKVFEEKDLPDFTTFRQKSHLETPDYLNNTSALDARFIYENVERDKKKWAYLVRDGELIVAQLFLYINGKTLHISLISVLKDYRREGLGKKLLEKAKDVAELAKLSEIELIVNKHNDAAIKFYLELGYKQTGIYDSKNLRMTYFLQVKRTNFFSNW